MKWARVSECALALWLLASPMLFGHAPGSLRVVHDVGVAVIMLALSLGSMVTRARRLHLLNLAIALWLVGVGYAFRTHGAAAENHLTLGLLLLMFAIVPTDAWAEPAPWRGRHATDASHPVR